MDVETETPGGNELSVGTHWVLAEAGQESSLQAPGTELCSLYQARQVEGSRC